MSSSRVIFLDAGPLGLASNPNVSQQAQLCSKWIADVLASGHRIVVPEIADYEVRRELIRGRKTAGLLRLDALSASLEYAPLTTAAMQQAALFWAQARQQGRPTASDKAIDGDVILAAQAFTFGAIGVIVATTNVSHLSRFVPTALWSQIK